MISESKFLFVSQLIIYFKKNVPYPLFLNFGKINIFFNWAILFKIRITYPHSSPLLYKKNISSFSLSKENFGSISDKSIKILLIFSFLSHSTTFIVKPPFIAKETKLKKIIY